jgi:Allene oxide cyclase barrel like domain
MRRVFFAVILVAMLGIGVGVGSASLAAGGPANRSKPMVIKLISRATAINNFVDTGPTGLSPGDLYVYSDRLFLANAPDQQLGTIDGRCVLIDPASFRFDCSNTGHIPEGAPLPAGDIQSAGTLTLVQGTTSTFAIVGGTGAYRTARGDSTVDLGPMEGPHQVTVNLILNP